MKPHDKATIREFDTFEEAFSYCREANRPIVVKIKGETWKLYPSGKAVLQGARREHDKATCLNCPGEYLTPACVADALGLSVWTLYAGAAGTGCLFAGRIKRGSRVFYLRARVQKHLELEAQMGFCDGRCRKAQPARAVLQLVERVG